MKIALFLKLNPKTCFSTFFSKSSSNDVLFAIVFNRKTDRYRVYRQYCMVAYACHSKITNCLSIFIVVFQFFVIFFVLIDLIC